MVNSSLAGCAHDQPMVDSNMVFRFSVTTVLCLIAVSAQADDYRLGPQDQLQIRVLDLRSGNGQAYQWPAFDVPYTVNAAGKVSLPLIGDIPAADNTTEALAASIAEKLQAKVGLAGRPDASVQILRYRPFYVVGGVEKAGEYEFRPGLTVLQAISIAGGFSRLSGEALLTFERDALTNRGDLRVMWVDRLALLARQARLDAEINDAKLITLPDELKSHERDPDVARLIREEQMLFDSRAYSLKSQTDALKDTKVILQQQVQSLRAKDVSLVHQLELYKAELDQVTGLVSKGLAVLPRQLAVQQTTAQFEGDRLNVQLATLRTQQDITKADRDILDLTNSRRNAALQEATEVRSRLAETAQKSETAQRLLVQAEVRAPMSLAATSEAAMHPVYALVRRVRGVVETRSAKESDLVEPGDVVRVDPVQTSDRSPSAEGLGRITPGSLMAN